MKLTRRTTRDQKIIYLRIYYSSTVKKNNVLCKKTIELFVTNRSRNCFFFARFVLIQPGRVLCSLWLSSNDLSCLLSGGINENPPKKIRNRSMERMGGGGVGDSIRQQVRHNFRIGSTTSIVCTRVCIASRTCNDNRNEKYYGGTREIPSTNTHSKHTRIASSNQQY